MATDIIFSQSDKLLKAIAGCGLLMTFISLIAVIIIVINYFTNHVNQGWSSTIAAIFLMSGMILFAIGIVGIYIGNIFIQIKERPLYVVRNILNYKERNEK